LDYTVCREKLRHAHKYIKKGVKLGDKLFEELTQLIGDLDERKINKATFNDRVKRFGIQANMFASHFCFADLLIQDAARKSEPPDNVIVLKVDRQRKLFPE
jgi:hypothetical protein